MGCSASAENVKLPSSQSPKYYIGVDFGGTNISAGVVNHRHEIIKTHSVKTLSQRQPKLIIADMAELIRTVTKMANLDFEKDVAWVGIGAPGTINGVDGVVEYSNNINWFDVPLGPELKKDLNKPIFMDNDANAAAYGEYLEGSAKGSKIFVMMTLGTGVGGGIIINNKIFTGFNSAGAELGHKVIILDGRQCTCGRKGCLEAYASATGIISLTKEIMNENKDSLMWDLVENDIEKVTGQTCFDAREKGDEAGKKVTEQFIRYLACGVTDIINVFQPDLLSIGGGISAQGDWLINEVKALVAEQVFTKFSKNNTKIIKASLGNDAGILGAALLGKTSE
ncbi:Glucokinase, ROK family [Spironucleus salmonicida]|uniref:Glucokinase, ROK family n=1 Tax=Spironucleus salmonicida TaxID=348837 RepID=V6LVT7_9EUKA|nr:Glucokinase, ROK family [Spironucleus salmonicida]|eukprot:EST48742.1 Glucokinase, ROK family [Spironucleus salmonicida]